MSRYSKSSESPAPFRGDDLYEASPEPSRPRHTNAGQSSMSPSPATSVSSDKENRSSRPVDKGKGRMPMGPPRAPSPSSERSKRKRTNTNTAESENLSDRNRRRRTVEVEDPDDYNPDQDIEERRQLRKGLRDLTKRLADNRSDYLAKGSTGLRDTIIRADELSDQVKQTSDATIDARLLVTTADLSYKKTIALTSGDSAQGVDLDRFISRCCTFMKSAPNDDHDDATPSQSQRRRTNNGEEEDEDGDMLNWAHLGRYAALPNIYRPAVPGFLLGPLSTEKRAKRVVVRKAAFRPNALQETRPEVLQSKDIEKSQNSNLTTLCTQILRRANKVLQDSMVKADEEAQEDMTDEEKSSLLDRNGISETGGLALFKFVINPWSFGQTIENLFYVSFLIRDGKAGISVDKRGLPYLDLISADDDGNQRQRGDDGSAKHQAVLALDMATWKQLIEAFDIKEPMIRHREDEEHNSVGKRGWYA
ncbi:hypothetical protein G7Y89_g11781 [Cudoniella acicularis]|uniref:Non-structural maintenance of chromosomes element 4 n=1 Tax=Cudoniella acicularis TaxID=354080 RepID=A0A8H4VY01_9HELO|nr:hypothetical protein G7Y89_g11781 [Cudoniella acicularis]